MAQPGPCSAQLSQATCSEISPWHSQAALALPGQQGGLTRDLGWIKSRHFSTSFEAEPGASSGPCLCQQDSPAPHPEDTERAEGASK